MTMGMAFSDPVTQITFLLSRLFCFLEGFQRIPEPSLCFFLIRVTAKPKQVYPSQIIAGIAVSPACLRIQ